MECPQVNYIGKARVKRSGWSMWDYVRQAKDCALYSSGHGEPPKGLIKKI